MSYRKKAPCSLATKNPVDSSASIKKNPDGSLQIGNVRFYESGFEENHKKEYKKYEDFRLDSLELLGVLGHGASSFVRLAKHKKTNKLLVCKIMNIFDRPKRHQLLKEIGVLYDADCVNLIGFEGAFYHSIDGKIWIGLEYMDLGSLKDVLAQTGPIAPNLISCIAKQLLTGLEYMHSHNQVHRDVKPSNILLNSDGFVKLADFGISVQLDTPIQMRDTFIGTSCYMSPERITAQSYTFPGDIWSLGLVLLECALGRFPYHSKARSYIDLVQHIIHESAPILPSEYKEGFEDLRKFLLYCLDKKPENRKTTKTLINHPFIQHASSINELKDFLKKVNKKSMDITSR